MPFGVCYLELVVHMGSVLAAFSLYSNIWYAVSEAVISAEDAEVRFELFDTAPLYFALSKGMKGRVIESNREWNKAGRTDGKIGWLRNLALERVSA